MEVIESIASLSLSPSSSSTTSSEPFHLNLHSPTPSSKSPVLPPSVMRLWRPAAQRNLRNQWSKLASYQQQWFSSSSSGRSHATSLVNSYLSQRYMDAMDFGVLSDMPKICEKACYKLFKQQEVQRRQLLSSYKGMVGAIIGMMNASRSMRCFSKGGRGSPLIQFSSISETTNDTGDGGGIPVFTFVPISTFEILAQELVEMFRLELILKRFLVVELLSINCTKDQGQDQLSWSDELYDGENDDLALCNLISEDTVEPLLPRIKGCRSDTASTRSTDQPDREVLQVYLTTWLVDVNIDKHRVEEIFARISEEMHVSFLP